MLYTFITIKLAVFSVLSERHDFLCGQQHVREKGAPLNKIWKTLSQAYERPFIQYKWYDAEMAQYLACME